MDKGRLEAFSDGVIAILITIMVLELKVPHGADLEALRPLFPVLLAYTMSFVYLGIYWSNHHHLLQAAEQVNGVILWANLHLLFWLSLVPIATAWMGEAPRAAMPTALYGLVLLLAGAAYSLLTRALVAAHGSESLIAIAVGCDRKGMLSLALYAVAIPLSWASPWLARAVYVLVAVLWLQPDSRIERLITRRRPAA